ncbi:hypothetical protein PILCRDRAFT_813290, partial [Piloderma croceum F 1598]
MSDMQTNLCLLSEIVGRIFISGTLPSASHSSLPHSRTYAALVLRVLTELSAPGMRASGTEVSSLPVKRRLCVI